MTYTVKEIFKTLQGEGTLVGRPAVFCRFAGCNLWSGREQDRTKAVCQFCDTDFVGGTKHQGRELAEAIVDTWGPDRERRLVVLTGGEPMLQVDGGLIDDLHGRGFFIAIETNGTLPVPREIDWICYSPKANAKRRVSRFDELKLPFPQQRAMPDQFEHLHDRLLLQPIDGPDLGKNTEAAIAYCLAHPKWRLSLQTHKFVGIR